MRGRWRATGCGIPRYHRHSALGRLSVYGMHAHIETVAQIAKVLPQHSLGGFTGLKIIRFSRRLAYSSPAFEAIAVVRSDLQHVDYHHTVSLSGMSGTQTYRFDHGHVHGLLARPIWP